MLLYNYPVEGPEDLIRKALRLYGEVEDIKFRHWPHMPNVGDGVRVIRMVRTQLIPRHMNIGEVRVKIAYARQQQICDMCNVPGHITRNCPDKNVLVVAKRAISSGIAPIAKFTAIAMMPLPRLTLPLVKLLFLPPVLPCTLSPRSLPSVLKLTR